MDKLQQYRTQLKNKTTSQILKWAINEFGSHLTLASSLGPQSIVLTHKLQKLTENPDVFVIDTGRLHNETYSLLSECIDFFELDYRIFFPDQVQIEKFMQNHGPNGFYKSAEIRKKCCRIRKVNVLKRAVKGYQAWISGVRREQNSTRQDVHVIEWDERFNLYKINPMVKWKLEEVWDYIQNNKLPYNKLHDRGYQSIGCDPCTRSVQNGEDPRSGRWWWEDQSNTECGLNLTGNRTKSPDEHEIKVPDLIKNLKIEPSQ